MLWEDRSVLITGGASFIGANLALRLVNEGARVRVIDNLSTGRFDSICEQVERGSIDFRNHDVEDAIPTAQALRGVEYVFHLAANHGGRGYIDAEQASCSRNLAIDQAMIRLAAEAEVRNLVFASSGCVYPRSLQNDPRQARQLREDDVGPPYDPDTIYGWAKLSAELTLGAYRREGKLRSVSCRFFTVYGPNNTGSHALQALIERAWRREDPFEVWGDGTQVRNWTYVDDIVEGTLRAAIEIDDASAVNLGTSVGTTIAAAAKIICKLLNHNPTFTFRPEMPTGPINRVACHDRATALLGWSPRTELQKGLQKTIEWYLRSAGPPG